MPDIIETVGSIELLSHGPVNVRIDKSLVVDGQTFAMPPWRVAFTPGADISQLASYAQDVIRAHWANPDVQAAWAVSEAARLAAET